MPITTIRKDVANLLFDPGNPRLPETLKRDQTAMFRYLVDDIGIEDVMASMAASGMIKGDPMIARPDGNGKYFVIEGNRRLAALKLLNGEKIGDGGEEPSIPPVRPELTDTLKEVDLEIGWEQDKLDAYLGYKHVTATREWSPEAKARFVLERCGGNLRQENLGSFAQRLGTTAPTLKRWIVALLALKQAEEKGIFSPKEANNKRYFGTFYTLLGNSQVQSFLALRSDPSSAEIIPQDHLPQLKEFISWVIGTKKEPPVVNSRKQKELETVLASPRALEYFRAKRDLTNALLYTEFNATEVATKLQRAAFELQDCLPTLNDVKDDPSVQRALSELDRSYQKIRLNIEDVPERKS